MRRLAALAPLAALGALVVIFAGYALGHDPHVRPAALVGHPVPKVALPGLDGGPPQPLEAVIGGRPVLVNFFASWCAPCAEEQPALMALKAQGVPIVGVAWKDEPQKSRAFLQRLGDPFAATLSDVSGRAGVEFGISGVPETFLVSAEGRILAKQSEPLTAKSAEALLERLDPR